MVVRVIQHRYFTHGSILFIGLLVGVGLAVWYFTQVSTPLTNITPQTGSSSATPTNEVGQVVTAAKLDPQTIKQSQDDLTKYLTVEGALLGLSDNFSVYFKSLNIPLEVSIEPTRSWIPASTIKAYVILEAFRQRDTGAIDFNQAVSIKASNVVPTELESEDYPRLREGTSVTIKQLIEAMIIQSDNTAYNSLLDILDRRNINLSLRSIGLTETVVGEKLNLDDTQAQQDVAVPGRQANTTTAKDLATLFDLLYNHKVADADEIVSIFKKQKINNMIPALLPQATTVAHKTGDWNPIFHDGGVVFKPNDPFILTIFTDGGSPEIVSKLAQVAYFRDPDHVGKELSLNSSPGSSYPAIALAGDVEATKVLAETSSKFPDLTAQYFGISVSDLTSKDQVAQNLGSATLSPGNFFYGIKRGLENFRLALAGSPQAKAQVYLDLSRNRLAEVKSQLTSGHSGNVASLLSESEKDLEQATNLSKSDPNQDLINSQLKGLLDLHYAVLKSVSGSISRDDKRAFVEAVYNFHQKEQKTLAPIIGKINITNPNQQKPLVGTVTNLTANLATVQLDDGTSKQVILTPESNVREYQQTTFSATSSIGLNERIAVVGKVTSSGKVVGQLILHNVPVILPVKQVGIVTNINPGQRTIVITNNQGQTETFQVAPTVSIKSKDTDVSIEGIKAGSTVAIFAAPAEKTISKSSPTPSASSSVTGKTSSSSSVKTTTASASLVKPQANNTKAASVTVIINNSGKNERILR